MTHFFGVDPLETAANRGERPQDHNQQGSEGRGAFACEGSPLGQRTRAVLHHDLETLGLVVVAEVQHLAGRTLALQSPEHEHLVVHDVHGAQVAGPSLMRQHFDSHRRRLRQPRRGGKHGRERALGDVLAAVAVPSQRSLGLELGAVLLVVFLFVIIRVLVVLVACVLIISSS